MAQRSIGGCVAGEGADREMGVDGAVSPVG